MEQYLLQLSYSAAGWQAIVAAGETFDQRLDSVRRLIDQLGGSFASFHFYDSPAAPDQGRRHVVRDKFATFGTHDLMAILAMPDKNAAQSFLIALSTQAGIRHVELLPLVPFEDVINSGVPRSKAAMDAAGYHGPHDKAPPAP